MNPLRRYETIMEILLAQKEVTVNELSERLDVTGKTIREDLAKLEEKGLLLRIHGGAMLAQSDQLGILSVERAESSSMPIKNRRSRRSRSDTFSLGILLRSMAAVRHLKLLSGWTISRLLL